MEEKVFEKRLPIRPKAVTCETETQLENITQTKKTSAKRRLGRKEKEVGLNPIDFFD